MYYTTLITKIKGINTLEDEKWLNLQVNKHAQYIKYQAYTFNYYFIIAIYKISSIAATTMWSNLC
jgi:hypothetical protein